jgi:hypothetical protein
MYSNLYEYMDTIPRNMAGPPGMSGAGSWGLEIGAVDTVLGYPYYSSSKAKGVRTCTL